ncbi:major facilitator superfamily domain-containing protein [Aspergillus heterothallicus]
MAPTKNPSSSEYHEEKPIQTAVTIPIMPMFLQNMPEEERRRAERKLVRKIDFRLLSMTFVMYILNYLDRNNIASAKLAGLEADLGLVGNQYQTSVSILFVGYILMQVPSNLLLNKLGKPSIYLPTAMVVWGVISTATAATQSFSGLVACRFFLGFAEAAYFPGCLYLLSCWYTRTEMVKRTALLYSGSLISGAFSGLIAAGVTKNLNGAKGLLAWRWLFIIEGAITIAIALISYFIIPDLPRTTPWLSEQEKDLAAWRLEEDIGEEDWVEGEQQSFFLGAKKAFLDYKVWLLLGIVYGSTSAGSISNFFPAVMKGLGKGDVVTLLLTTPPYLIGTIMLILNAWHSDKTGERYLHIVLPAILAVAVFILGVATTSFVPRYIAMCLLIGSIYSGYIIGLGYISNVIPRPADKRAAGVATITCLSNACQIYTSYFYPDTDAPRYTKAFCINIAMLATTIAFATILRIALGRENKKLDLQDAAALDEGDSAGVRRSNGFRYLL